MHTTNIPHISTNIPQIIHQAFQVQSQGGQGGRDGREKEERKDAEAAASVREGLGAPIVVAGSDAIASPLVSGLSISKVLF